MAGKYILFEGIDGVGKSTQIKLLDDRFHNLVITREPGGTDFGLQIREILLNSTLTLSPMSETLFFLVDRAEHFNRIVSFATANGGTVVSDRGLLSGIAYSRDEAFTDRELIDLNLKAIKNRKPDLLFLFTISKEKYIERLEKRGNLDRIESFGIDFAMETQERFKKFSELVAKRVIYIDSEKSMNEIHELVSSEVEKCLNS
ncbi:thymidylate kinase [Thiovulum sp. ES]|nr:thymidylate kinase [Thiovulum sp. ES]